jgi:hypothetical protein
MAEQIKIQKTVYGAGSFSSLVNTNFNQLARSVTTNNPEDNIEPNVDGFFEDYNTLFFDIPKEGSENSHQSLIYRSMQYLGVSLEDLLSELDILRQENTELKNQILLSTGLSPNSVEEI